MRILGYLMVKHKIKLTCALLLYLILRRIRKKKKERRNRRYSVRPTNRRRKEKSFYYITFLPMKEQRDEQKFFRYTRMTFQSFDKLLAIIEPSLRKRSIREPICAEERLAVTIHYLAHGCSMAEAATVYCMGYTTSCLIIKEVCCAIRDLLQPQYIPPLEEVNWKEKADEYLHMWEMPHCCAAIDGKHVMIQAPNKSGSKHFNYKKFFSINLMAACDAKLNFVYVDIGAEGSLHDSAVFRDTELAKMTSESEYKYLKYWPKDDVLPNTDTSFPFYFVADAAFPLSKRLQRPYPGKNLCKKKEIYNYRLSRARRTIENAFGLLSSRWRLLRRPIIALEASIEVIVGAMVCLHNFLNKEQGMTENRNTVNLSTEMKVRKQFVQISISIERCAMPLP